MPFDITKFRKLTEQEKNAPVPATAYVKPQMKPLELCFDFPSPVEGTSAENYLKKDLFSFLINIPRRAFYHPHKLKFKTSEIIKRNGYSTKRKYKNGEYKNKKLEYCVVTWEQLHQYEKIPSKFFVIDLADEAWPSL